MDWEIPRRSHCQKFRSFACSYILKTTFWEFFSLSITCIVIQICKVQMNHTRTFKVWDIRFSYISSLDRNSLLSQARLWNSFKYDSVHCQPSEPCYCYNFNESLTLFSLSGRKRGKLTKANSCCCPGFFTKMWFLFYSHFFPFEREK